MKLYSYVVQHDYGHAPNPYFGVCTLAWCMFRDCPTKPRNITELACVGDWVVGTGGLDPRKSAGHGKLIYAMKVEKKLTLGQYWSAPEFKEKKRFKGGNYAQRRGDNIKPKSAFEENERFALLSRKEFYYFGKEAIEIPLKFLSIQKIGPRYKVKFEERFVEDFLACLRKKYKPGKHGEPWGKEFKLSQEMKKREACESSC